MLSMIFFFGFRQWKSPADRGLTLDMNILLPLFWSTWSLARGQDKAICASLEHRGDYRCDWSISIASEQE